jgi:exodeoxyribonuclease-3
VIAATIDGVRIISVYVVNGGEIDSGKYAYKLKWLKRLENYLAAQDCTAQLAICGDYNIVPHERDAKNHDDWWGGVLYNKDLDTWFKRFIDLGLQDTLRIHHKEAEIYSWWDYRMLAFPKNNGLRIDFILATNKLAARSADAGVDRDERKGKKPSDHAPVFAEFHD